MSNTSNLAPGTDGIKITSSEKVVNKMSESNEETKKPETENVNEVQLNKSNLPEQEQNVQTVQGSKSSGNAENAVKKERKVVSFASEPEEVSLDTSYPTDPQDEEELKANIFGKIPPELSYLEPRSDQPKPLPQVVAPKFPKKTKKVLSLDDLPDLPSRAVKEISAVNKNTVLNFNYHEVILPIGPDRILVDVKYSSLFSPDLAKLRKYSYNISNERIGIGYDFVGEIVELGKKHAKSEIFKKGTKVFGVTNPLEKKGALQTCVIVNPNDIILVLTDDDIKSMENIDIALSLTPPSSFRIEESDVDESVTTATTPEDANLKNNLPPLAKLCTFGSQYCRAKQAISHMDRVLKKQGSANILINGADTLLGRTIIQLIASSVYHDTLQTYNVTLIVLENNVQDTKSFVSQFNCGGLRNFNVVAYDMVNEDLVLPGETVPINYKKVPFFASEVFESVLKIIPDTEKIGKQDAQRVKLDLFIDIIGSKKMFQKLVDVLKLDQVNFPFKGHLEEGVKPSSIFGKTKGPLFLKLMKAKSYGSSFVSFCDFELSEPSYLVDKMISHNGSALDPWALSWTRGLANRLVSSYNYYEISELQIKKEWVEEALSLVKAGELRIQIDGFVEWRNDFRSQIERMRKRDGLVVFQVESF